MVYIILKIKKIFNMLHQKIKMILFLFCSFRIQFMSICLSFKCIQLNKITFLLNIGTIKDKDGLMVFEPTNVGSIIYLRRHAICQRLIYVENPVLVNFSHSCFLFKHGQRKGRHLQWSNHILLLFEWHLYSFSQNMIL